MYKSSENNQSEQFADQEEANSSPLITNMKSSLPPKEEIEEENNPASNRAFREQQGYDFERSFKDFSNMNKKGSEMMKREEDVLYQMNMPKSIMDKNLLVPEASGSTKCTNSTNNTNIQSNAAGLKYNKIVAEKQSKGYEPNKMSKSTVDKLMHPQNTEDFYDKPFNAQTSQYIANQNMMKNPQMQMYMGMGYMYPYANPYMMNMNGMGMVGMNPMGAMGGMDGTVNMHMAGMNSVGNNKSFYPQLNQLNVPAYKSPKQEPNTHVNGKGIGFGNGNGNGNGYGANHLNPIRNQGRNQTLNQPQVYPNLMGMPQLGVPANYQNYQQLQNYGLMYNINQMNGNSYNLNFNNIVRSNNSMNNLQNSIGAKDFPNGTGEAAFSQFDVDHDSTYNKRSKEPKDRESIISSSSNKVKSHSNTNKSRESNSSDNITLDIDVPKKNGMMLANNAIYKKVEANKKLLYLDKKQTSIQNANTSYKEDSVSQATESENLDDIMSNMKVNLHEYICSQQGSRVFQRELNKITPEKLDEILYKLSGYFKELMVDVYGNYFSQKLVQCCTSEQRVFILKNIMSDFNYISCNSSGTHSMQALIELINMKNEEEVVMESIKNSVSYLALDPNGTHVVQKVVSAIKEENREPVNEAILENFGKFVLDNNGVCVAKKFISKNTDEKIRTRVIEIILGNCLEVIQNPFGNYIIQHIFDSWPVQTCQKLIKVIIDNLGSLSMQKFSSNVVEKCFDLVDTENRKRMIKELFSVTKIASLIKNKFGMFVLQKAIEMMMIEEKLEIKEYLLKKLNTTSKQEKSRLKALIDLL